MSIIPAEKLDLYVEYGKEIDAALSATEVINAEANRLVSFILPNLAAGERYRYRIRCRPPTRVDLFH